MTRNRLTIVNLLFYLSLCCLNQGCDSQDEPRSGGVIRNASLQDYQTKLLVLAFDSASGLPLYPHIKDRARAQEQVVQACLELDQDQRAYEYIAQIPNWRAGMGYADLAFKKAQSGATFKEIEPLIGQAMKVADASEGWRKDRIKARVAQVQACLGRAQEAASLEQGIEEAAESGKVAQITALTCPAEAFDSHMAALEAQVDTGQYDLVQNALHVYIALFNRFYADSEKRGLVEDKIKVAWSKIPYTVRIDLLGQMTDVALANEDRPKAIALANEAKAMSEQVDLVPRFAIPMMAQLAQLCFRVGDPLQAKQEVEAALALYEAQKAGIVNIDRAGLLRSLAEAYQVMGQSDQSLTLYRRAIEAGVENPNSRPRAEDLAATCCSMAIHAVEPDGSLWQRIHEIKESLGDPW
ncbi:MAG: tetratricopeptide repeat protein [Phycisphaerae bacterium]|nr:tetratricopeptide repeat protein [Phycisphaerae bacterium]